MKIAIIGVGTELTDGQILNRNGQWLSQRMYELGVQTTSHVVVPDETSLILQALDFAHAQAEILFVTGGLGPTSDDFTRDVISQWTKQRLEFDEKSWQHLQSQLTSRGLPATDMHKQECFFPKSAKVFRNNNGTANAFSMKQGGHWIFVLPGPPKEIETLWKDFLHTELREICRDVDAQRTWSWDCIGLAEADLAARIEKEFGGCPLQKGYRVHLPYVEFKLFYPESKKTEMLMWKDKVEKILSSWIISRDGKDILPELVEKLKAKGAPVWICDELTQSSLLQRFVGSSQGLLKDGVFSFCQRMPANIPAGIGLHLCASHLGQSPLLAVFEYYVDGDKQSVECQAPERFSAWPERQKQFFSEMALVHWLRRL
jgi:nicotinamide-nucleotide amidase